MVLEIHRDDTNYPGYDIILSTSIEGNTDTHLEQTITETTVTHAINNLHLHLISINAVYTIQETQGKSAYKDITHSIWLRIMGDKSPSIPGEPVKMDLMAHIGRNPGSHYVIPDYKKKIKTSLLDLNTWQMKKSYRADGRWYHRTTLKIIMPGCNH